MIIRCPECGFSGRIPEERNGRDTKRVVCPSCGHRFTVGLVVLSPEGETPEVSSPPTTTSDTAGERKEAPGTRDASLKSEGARKRKRHPVLWGCLITVAVLAVGTAILILISGVSREIQESREYDVIKKLGEKYPGYLLLNSIKTDPGTMTDLQITSYQRNLIGRGCVGMGTIVDVEKTTGSAVLDFFGLTAPGTIITLTYERYDIELVLAESYSDEFLSYHIGDTVLFAGIIRKAAIAGRTSLSLSDVVIEGHSK